MLFQLLTFSLTFLMSVQALIKCNGTVQKLQLCSLHENHNKGVVSTGWDNFELPQTVASSIILINIVEFNANENTIINSCKIWQQWFINYWRKYGYGLIWKSNGQMDFHCICNICFPFQYFTGLSQLESQLFIIL